MTEKHWEIEVKLRGERGEVHLRQAAPNGSAKTRQSVIDAAILLYKELS